MSINKSSAAAIYDNMTVTVERFHQNVKLHPKATFLGYADVSINVLIGGQDVGCALRLRGLQCKILSDSFRLDMPGDKVEKDGKVDYVPHFFPLSGEFRAVLELRVSEDARVIAAVDAAIAMATAGTGEVAAQAEGNPFRA